MQIDFRIDKRKKITTSLFNDKLASFFFLKTDFFNLQCTIQNLAIVQNTIVVSHFQGGSVSEQIKDQTQFDIKINEDDFLLIIKNLNISKAIIWEYIYIYIYIYAYR